LVLASFLGNFSLTFLDFYKRLFGKRKRVRPKANLGERWATVAPVRSSGCPQARPVGRTVVHGGRVAHAALALAIRDAASFKR
jgi:hypothetical protein